MRAVFPFKKERLVESRAVSCVDGINDLEMQIVKNVAVIVQVLVVLVIFSPVAFIWDYPYLF